MNTVIIERKDRTLSATVHLPFSKSISNRLLMMKAISGKKFLLKNISDADDTKLLQKLILSNNKVLDAQNAGTCYRFLTAYLSQKAGEWTLTGSDRMKARPIGALVDALRKLGADIKYLEKENFPPLLIKGKKLMGGELTIDASQSSQFISALLLIAPSIEGGMKLNTSGEVSSMPYVEMTMRLMEHFGIKITGNKNSIEIPQQEYITKEYLVERDWSSAAFWFGLAAMSDSSEIFLEGLTEESIQGDSIVMYLMKNFGVETKFTTDGAGISLLKKASQKKCEFNFSQCPDLAPVFFVLCSALGVEATFYGVKNLAIKESNRAEAIKTELEKCGAEILKRSDDEYFVRPHPLAPSPKGEGE
ncbi:MAG: 3-phosphoshikimate 1-carboxyvinyltransferase, partial [Bacteroidia bacterium]|nr:3-phosphoshikimate 1-carboxyvinyltransferase [Bacteroidia bacterium]